MIHTAAMTATQGTPLFVQVEKIFGAFCCTDIPYRMRDEEKTNVFAAEKADVISTALIMEGRTEHKAQTCSINHRLTLESTDL